MKFNFQSNEGVNNTYGSKEKVKITKEFTDEIVNGKLINLDEEITEDQAKEILKDSNMKWQFRK